MRLFRRQLSRKVEQARNQIVAKIQDLGMKAGDKLPSYTEMRKELDVGSQTIADAVMSLCEAGMLEVRDKVGIFVKNPVGGNMAGRAIAVVTRAIEGSAYSATLTGFIQQALIKRGCRCETFYRNPDATAPKASITDFLGLETALTERRCQGVVTLCPFDEVAMLQIRAIDVPCCFVGDSDQSPEFGVFIDVNGFLDDACRALRDKGCKRVIQLAVSEEQLAARKRYALTGMVGESYGGGEKIAEKLLALAPEKRPDGIVSDDDTVVSGLLAALVKKQLPNVDYMPYIATIVHSELNESYPSNKMLIYKQSITEFAGLTAKLLMQVLRRETIRDMRVIYRLTSVDNESTADETKTTK